MIEVLCNLLLKLDGWLIVQEVELDASMATAKDLLQDVNKLVG